MKKVQNVTTDYNSFVRSSYKRYAISVLSDRALPDFRDGLKPVQRKMLWTAYKLGLHNNKAFTKCTNITGNLMARFSPHADAYGVLVNLTGNSVKFNLFEGNGNFGNYIDEAAAPRYTEAKLSKYSDDFLLNQNYLEVCKMLPNYLDTEEEPMLLPSLLPVLFLIGCQGIAVGYKTEIPTFTLKSLIKVVKKGLVKKLKGKDLLCLEFDDIYNAQYVGTDQQLLDYYTSGKAALPFSVSYKLDNTKSFTINSIIGNGETMINKIESDDRVYQVNDLTSGNDIKIQVVLKPSIASKDVKNVAADIVSKLKINRIFITNVIKRVVTEQKDGDHTFYDEGAVLKESNPVDLLNEWIKWRVELEVKMLNNQVSKTNDKVNQLEFYRYLISKLDIIFKVLKSKTNDLKGAMKKALKCTDDQAQTVLDMPVRRLSKLSDDELKGQIKDLQQYAKDCKKWLKNPQDKILQDLDKIKV